MKAQITRFLTVFLAWVLLMPTAFEFTHSINHKDEFKCNSSEKHFHEKEDHCSICDFVLPLSIEAEDEVSGFKTFLSSINYFPLLEFIFIPYQNYNFSLRGPPSTH